MLSDLPDQIQALVVGRRATTLQGIILPASLSSFMAAATIEDNAVARIYFVRRNLHGSVGFGFRRSSDRGKSCVAEGARAAGDGKTVRNCCAWRRSVDRATG